MNLEFDPAELAVIATARATGGNIWDNPVVAEVKWKIKQALLSKEVPQCCYCARLFQGEHNIVIDTEHVLPKSIYVSEIFNMQNLNVACKRCNMGIKRNDVSFLADVAAMGAEYYNSRHYLFVHPNLDRYTDHLVVEEVRVGDIVVKKYVVKTQNKGKYTYEYFRLDELEIDTLNISQGLSPAEDLNEDIDQELREQAKTLLQQL